MTNDIDLNFPPYYDDFDEEKNYARILFNPSRPVQARELTQIQSGLQKQIGYASRFFFKHGDVAVPGGLKLSLNANYVLTNWLVQNSDLSRIVDREFIGVRSGVRARVIHAENVENQGRGGTVLYVNYTSAGDKIEIRVGTETGTISAGDTLVGATSGASITVLSKAGKLIIANFNNDRDVVEGESLIGSSGTAVVSSLIDYTDFNSFLIGEDIKSFNLVSGVPVIDNEWSFVATENGLGSLVSIEKGVYFVKDTYVQVFPQTIALDPFGQTPTFRVGLVVSEEIVTPKDDPSLLDPSMGSSNYLGIGADRLKINLTLAKRPIEDDSPNPETTDDFVEILRIREGRIEYQATFRYREPALMATLAERTFDESGNYTVKPFPATIREHSLEVSDPDGNFGVFSGGSESKIAVELGAGKAYVGGYKVEIPEVRFVSVDKARDTEISTNQTVSTDSGQYVLVHGLYRLPRIATNDGQTEAFPIVDLWNDDVASVIGTGATIKQWDNPNTFVLPDSFPSFPERSFNKGTAILRYETNGNVYTEAYEIIGSTGRTIILNSAVNPIFLSVPNETTFNIIGPNPSEIDPLVEKRFKGKRIGTARIKDVVLETGSTHGIDGIYRVYLFDIVMERGYVLDQAKSFVLREEPYLGSGMFLNQPKGLRANILKKIFIKNFSGVPFSTKFFRDGTVSPFTRLRTVKIDGTSDIVTAYILGWDVQEKSLLIQNVTGLVANSDKFNSTIDIGDLVEEIDQSNDKTGAFGEVYESKKIFTSGNQDEASFLYPLPNQFVKSVNGVSIFGVRRTLNKVAKGNTVDFYTDKAGEVFAASVGSLSTDAYGVETSLPGSGIVGIRNQDDYSISANNTSTLSVTLDPVVSFGTNVSVLTAVNKTAPKLRTKTISSSVADFFMDETSVKSEILPLTRTDIIRVERILASTTNSFGDDPNDFDIATAEDITDRYILDNGQRNSFYDNGRLILKRGAVEPQTPVVVFYRHFIHSDGDYFSVNSYPLSQMDYKDIPSFVSPTTGNVYPLSDYLDFRSSKDRLGNFSPNNGARIIEPPTVNSVVHIDSIEYYLPRIDKIAVDDNGDFFVIKGQSSLNPKVPPDAVGSMTLYVIKLAAYTKTTRDVSLSYIDNRRYTMRDIGQLDKRIQGLENYASLSLLEKATADLRIVDENGLDRSKQGFVVDNFTSHEIGDTSHPDYRCAVDPIKGELRPSFAVTYSPIRVKAVNPDRFWHNPEHEFDSYETNGVRIHNLTVAMLPHTIEYFANQRFATDAIPILSRGGNYFRGHIMLLPSGEFGKSEKIKPKVGVVDSPKSKAYLNERTFSGSIYDEWAIFGSGVDAERGSERIEEMSKRSMIGKSRNNEKQFSSASSRLSSFTTNKIIDKSVSFPIRDDVKIDFYAKGLKPNTRHYVFFDEQDVTEFCWPENEPVVVRNMAKFKVNLGGSAGVLGTASINEANWNGFFRRGVIVRQYSSISPKVQIASGRILYSDFNLKELYLDNLTGTFQSNFGWYSVSSETPEKFLPTKEITLFRGGGLPLFSNESGELRGTFLYGWTSIGSRINSQKPLYSGIKQFRITSRRDHFRTPNPESWADLSWRAFVGLEQDEEDMISTLPPHKVSELGFQNILNPENQGDTNTFIAQTFTVSGTIGGLFLTGVALYFKNKDEKLPVSIEIRNTENGKVGTTILPYSQVTKDSKDVVVSPDAGFQKQTTFTFPVPVYLEDGREYALVVRANSTKYEIFRAIIGTQDLKGWGGIPATPNLGRLYLPSNTPSKIEEAPNQELTVALFRAIFDTRNEGTLNLVNVPVDWQSINGSKIYTVAGSSYVRLEVPNTMKSGQVFEIAGVDSTLNGISPADLNTTHTVLPNGNFDYIYFAVANPATVTGYATLNPTNPDGDIKVRLSGQVDEAFIRIPRLSFPSTQTNWLLKARNEDGSNNPNLIPFEPDQIINFSQTRVLGSETFENTFTPSGSSSFEIFARLRTERDNLSPVIDISQAGIIGIGNRISNKSLDPSTLDVLKEVIIEPPLSNHLEFVGDNVLSFPDGAKFDQRVALDLTPYVGVDTGKPQDRTNATFMLSIGNLVTQVLPSSVAKGRVHYYTSNADTRILVLEEVDGVFVDRTEPPALVATKFVPSVGSTFPVAEQFVAPGVKMIGGEIVLSFSPSVTDLDNKLENGDSISIRSFGSVKNNIVGGVVKNVTSNTVVLSYGTSANVIKPCNRFQSGPVEIIKDRASSYITSSNSEAIARLNRLKPERFILISGDTIPPQNQTSSGFRVISSQNGIVIIDAPIVSWSSNNTANVVISQINDFISDLSPRGGSSESAYVTKQINLLNQADSIRVILSAMVPNEADIEVFYKTSLQSSGIPFEDIPWTPFNSPSPSSGVGEDSTLAKISSKPDSGSIIKDGTLREYNYSTFSNLPLFDSFAVKIVLKSSNTSKIPIVKDFRAIATAASTV